jgi:fermentation-respiration switch protein FrsA (DUF1100 family)
MRFKSVSLGFFNVLALMALNSCNHLFYYPDTLFYSDPKDLGVEYENLIWKNPEGLELQVLHMFSKKPVLGSVLHLHGNAQNRSSHFHFSYWLTQEGYDVYVPDYRGYGGSKGKPSRVGLVEDAKFFIREVCRKSARPVFIFGQSLGGALAIPALVQVIFESGSSCVSGMVIESSFASYRRMAREKLGSFWLSWVFQYPLSFLVSDNESPIDVVKDLKIPILFIHGTADPVVPYQHSKDLFEASGSVSKEFWTVEKGRHTPAFVGENTYKERLLRWLSQSVESNRVPHR